MVQLCHLSASVSSMFMLLRSIYTEMFLVTSFYLPFSEDWPLTWLTKHCPSVL